MKLLLFGATGTGKTSLSLAFPSPISLDLERGTAFFRDEYIFRARTPDSVDDVLRDVHSLAAAECETIIIDSVSVLWDLIRNKWTHIFRTNLDHQAFGQKKDYYAIQPNDYPYLRGDLKQVVARLLELDKHIVFVAREKPSWKNYKPVGVTFDCDECIAYLFDTIMHLKFNSLGKHVMECTKDRTGLFTLNKLIPTSINSFATLLSKEVKTDMDTQPQQAK